MLTRSLYVRRLVPANVDEYAKDPAAYAGEWNSNPDGEIGEAISETFMPMPVEGQPSQVNMVPMLGVCWFDTRTPAISYESPAFLENVDDEMEDAEGYTEEPLEELEEESA